MSRRHGVSACLAYLCSDRLATQPTPAHPTQPHTYTHTHTSIRLTPHPQGTVYDYRGPRDNEHLLAFARGGFKEVAGAPVPMPPTFIDLVKSHVNEAIEMVKAMYVQVLKEVQLVAKGEKPADAPFLVMVAMILVFFCLVVLTFAAIFTGPRGASGAEEAARKQEKKSK
jgi:hypothetical protein